MKDLVEHIRTVHFTVLVVALILLVASGIEKKRPLQQAASDAEALLLLQQRWADVNAELKKELDAAVSGDQIYYWDGKSWSTTAMLRPGPYGLDILTQGGARTHLRFEAQEWLYVTNTLEGTSSSSALPFSFSTLGQFLRLWDDFQSGNAAFAPLVLKPQPLPGPLPGYCAEARAEASGKINSGFAFGLERSGLAWRISPTLGSYSDGRLTCTYQAVLVRPLNIDLGPVLAKVAGHNWRKARSAEAFGDLIASSKHLEETPIAQLVDVLRDRADSDTERVELFQAKLPAKTIPTYGSIILIVCQLYLLAHLYELRRVAKGSQFSEWPTGYIGLYDGRLTRGLTIVALVCPAASILKVAWSITGPELYYARWAVFGASGILSALSIWTLIVVRRSGPRVGTK